LAKPAVAKAATSGIAASRMNDFLGFTERPGIFGKRFQREGRDNAGKEPPYCPANRDPEEELGQVRCLGFAETQFAMAGKRDKEEGNKMEGKVNHGGVRRILGNHDRGGKSRKWGNVSHHLPRPFRPFSEDDDEGEEV
jgi:hypothetical protein